MASFFAMHMRKRLFFGPQVSHGERSVARSTFTFTLDRRPRMSPNHTNIAPLDFPQCNSTGPWVSINAAGDTRTGPNCKT